MIYLGIDPGTNGVMSVMDGKSLVECRFFEAMKCSTGGLILDFASTLSMIRVSGARVAFIEKTWMGGNKRNKIRGQERLTECRGVILAALSVCPHITVYEVPVKTWQDWAFKGKGSGLKDEEERKKRSLKWAEQNGYELSRFIKRPGGRVPRHDASDAMIIGLCGYFKYGKTLG